MSMTIVPEVVFFVSSIGYGAALACCYDFLRVLRRVIKHTTPLVDAEDILFFLTAGLGFFGLLFVRNEGQMRWFAFAGCAIGVVLYEKTISRPIQWLGERLMTVILFPLRIFFTMLRKTLQILKKHIKMNV